MGTQKNTQKKEKKIGQRCDKANERTILIIIIQIHKIMFQDSIMI